MSEPNAEHWAAQRERRAQRQPREPRKPRERRVRRPRARPGWPTHPYTPSCPLNSQKGGFACQEAACAWWVEINPHDPDKGRRLQACALPALVTLLYRKEVAHGSPTG